MKTEMEEFGYIILKNRFYIFDLYSNTAFYVHCNLYNNYPENISPDQEHFDLPDQEEAIHMHFKLLLLKADVLYNSFEITIILLKAQAWFKNIGMQYFIDCIGSLKIRD